MIPPISRFYRHSLNRFFSQVYLLAPITYRNSPQKAGSAGIHAKSRFAAAGTLEMWYTLRSQPNASGGHSLWREPLSSNAPYTNFNRPGAVRVHHPMFLQSVKRFDGYGLNRSACRAFKIWQYYCIILHNNLFTCIIHHYSADP